MADPLDLLTLVEGKQAINMREVQVDHEATLARHITAVSRRVDARCGPVVVRTVTGEEIDGDGPWVRTSKRPVTSFTQVREAHGGSTSVISAVAFGGQGPGYRAPKWKRDPALYSGELERVGGCYWPCQVEITYVAGRYASTAVVDARFKDCASSILRRLWKRESATWGQASDFFEDADDTAGTGFFRVADPLIDEMLAADRDLPTCA